MFKTEVDGEEKDENFHLNQYANVLICTRGQSHDNKFKFVRNIKIYFMCILLEILEISQRTQKQKLGIYPVP